MNDGRREFESRFESSMTESGSDCGKVIVDKISSDVRGTKKIRARVVSDRDKPVKLKKMKIFGQDRSNMVKSTKGK